MKSETGRDCVPSRRSKTSIFNEPRFKCNSFLIKHELTYENIKKILISFGGQPVAIRKRRDHILVRKSLRKSLRHGKLRRLCQTATVFRTCMISQFGRRSENSFRSKFVIYDSSKIVFFAVISWSFPKTIFEHLTSDHKRVCITATGSKACIVSQFGRD